MTSIVKRAAWHLLDALPDPMVVDRPEGATGPAFPARPAVRPARLQRRLIRHDGSAPAGEAKLAIGEKPAAHLDLGRVDRHVTPEGGRGDVLPGAKRCMFST